MVAARVCGNPIVFPRAGKVREILDSRGNPTVDMLCEDSTFGYARLAGLAEREDHLPNQLSGGQQQRVAIARAVVNDPRIILADEPTGNLDTATSYEIMGLFRDLNDRGKTIVMITHEEDIATHCKRVLSVKDREIVEDRPNTALRNPEQSRQSETVQLRRVLPP